MADIDLLVEQAVTGERGVVQVKSEASQSEADEFWSSVAEGGFSRHWLIVHTGGEQLEPPDPRVSIWTVDHVAQAILRAGLLDWLLDRCR